MWRLLALVCAAASAGPAPNPAPAHCDLRRALPQKTTSLVDLVQVQFVLPGKVKIGKTFTVLDELENAGEAPAAATVTYFYLSEDDVLDEWDVAVGGRRAPQLGPRQTHSTVTPVTLKPDVKPGVYYLIALADAQRVLEERYRDNNTRAVRITVQPADKK